MVKIQDMQSDASKQFWLLRRYLRERNVPKTLAARIQRYLQYASEQESMHVQEGDVTMLLLLSKPLRNELRYITSLQFLVVHPLFQFLSEDSHVTLNRLCATESGAIQQKWMASEDPVFMNNEEGNEMYFVFFGELMYTHRCSGIQFVQREDWLCEP